MAKDCLACEELKRDHPDLIANGFSDEHCATFSEDKGLSANDGNDDCYDFELMNDCLIGNQEDEIERYDVCDWKEFMKKFIPNLWTMFKAIGCSMCGIWSNIWELWRNVEKLLCIVGYMGAGEEFTIGEEETDDSYVVAGKGISFLQSGSATLEKDVTFHYIGGALVQFVASLNFYDSNFSDPDSCWNFDTNGVDPRRSASRFGNPYWATTGTMITGGELLIELRIRKSAYPQISKIFEGAMLPTGGGDYTVNTAVYYEGEYASGQHGSCNKETGEPGGEGRDRGHLVPPGWIYVQARMVNITRLSSNGGRYSPRGFLGIQLNQDEIIC